MDFPEAEYHWRLERVQQARRVRQLDGLLCTTEAEMRYFQASARSSGRAIPALGSW